MLALAVICSLPAIAQTKVYREGSTWVQELTGTVPASRSLRINTESGNLIVQGGPGQGITYTVRVRVYTSAEENAKRMFEGFRVSTSRSNGVAVLEGEWAGGSPRKSQVDITVQVPSSMDQLKLQTEGGNITATGVSGRVEAQSGGGNLRLHDIAGSISAESGGGNVDIGNIGGGVDLNTGGGNIRVASSKGHVSARSGGGSVSVDTGDDMELHTGGGDIDVKKCTGPLQASTGGGNVDLGDVGGSVSISTGGGNIHLASSHGAVVAHTGGGDIELYKLSGTARADTGGGSITAEFIGAGGSMGSGSYLHTSGGDIIVYLSSDLKLSLRATIDMANGHELHSDFPEFKVSSEGGQWGPKTIYAEGSLNGGGPLLKVRTTTGDIELRRAKK